MAKKPTDEWIQAKRESLFHNHDSFGGKEWNMEHESSKLTLGMSGIDQSIGSIKAMGLRDCQYILVFCCVCGRVILCHKRCKTQSISFKSCLHSKEDASSDGDEDNVDELEEDTDEAEPEGQTKREARVCQARVRHGRHSASRKDKAKGDQVYINPSTYVKEERAVEKQLTLFVTALEETKHTLEAWLSCVRR